MTDHVRFYRKPFQIIRADLRVFLIINAIVFGFFILGLVAAMVFPELGAQKAASLEADGTNGMVRSLFENPWLFALVILAVNLFSAAAAWIVLPSLIVPFAAIPLFAYKAFTLGSGLFPTTEMAAVGWIPHSLTALIEFHAYSILVFGAYLLGRSWLRPATIGAPTRRQGYLRGLGQFGWLGLLALGWFIVGAIWEAYSLRYLVHPLSELLL
ncbi:hypothetical protein [Cryobacterium lactosi]|uniref:hypothetical protein n=1 Tax=Cryobacterium lactosi TaxID=1259202 RepID=UPI0018E0A92E|nr:hypothetical protein [Cryobacterium lactosi]